MESETNREDRIYDYDVIVIGGGSGGLAFAKEAKKINPSLKVAVFDFVQPSKRGTTWKLGGTCVNVGCIPKKLMHQAGLIAKTIRESSEYGFDIDKSQVNFSWEKMMDNINSYIRSLNWAYRKQLLSVGVDYYNSYVTFVDDHTVSYQDKNTTKNLTSKYFVVATGGRPNYGSYPGSELCLTSDDLFWLKRHPGQKVLVVGGGYIALECANFLNELGVEVDVMFRSKLLREFDEQCVEQVAELMERHGVKFIKDTPVRFDKTDRGVGVKTESDRFEEYDNIILAIGRTGCTDGFGLDKIGVVVLSLIKKIVVDMSNRTSVSNIYAIGDVAHNSLPELTPVAIKEGCYLAHHLFNYENTKLRCIPQSGWIPTTVFTSPEYACAGLNEQEADRLYGRENVEVWCSRYAPIENLITHPDFKRSRSKTFTGSNLWARRTFIQNKVYVDETCFNTTDYSQVYLDSDETVVWQIEEIYQDTMTCRISSVEFDKSENIFKVVELSRLSPAEETEEYEYQRYVKSDHLCKLITHKQTGTVVGVHFVGKNAGEIIQGFATMCASKIDVHKSDFDDMISIHPISAEEFLVLEVNRSSMKDFLKKEGCGGGSC